MNTGLWMILVFVQIILLVLCFIRVLVPGRLWTRKSATAVLFVLIAMTGATLWQYVGSALRDQAQWLASECKHIGEGTYSRKAYKCNDGFVYVL